MTLWSKPFLPSIIKWGASLQWSFGPNSAWGSIETATIGKTHPTLLWKADWMRNLPWYRFVWLHKNLRDIYDNFLHYNQWWVWRNFEHDTIYLVQAIEVSEVSTNSIQSIGTKLVHHSFLSTTTTMFKNNKGFNGLFPTSWDVSPV